MDISSIPKNNDGSYNLKDVIYKLSNGKSLLAIDKTKDKELLEIIQSAAKNCIESSVRINSTRINEVGNKMEEPLLDAFNEAASQAGSKLRSVRPKMPDDKGKSTGYPDILIQNEDKNYYSYLEIKIYEDPKNLDSTMRSFYVSPSEGFKVTQDARHLLLGFHVKEREKNFWSLGR